MRILALFPPLRSPGAAPVELGQWYFRSFALLSSPAGPFFLSCILVTSCSASLSCYLPYCLLCSLYEIIGTAACNRVGCQAAWGMHSGRRIARGTRRTAHDTGKRKRWPCTPRKGPFETYCRRLAPPSAPLIGCKVRSLLPWLKFTGSGGWDVR